MDLINAYSIQVDVKIKTIYVSTKYLTYEISDSCLNLHKRLNFNDEKPVAKIILIHLSRYEIKMAL